MNNIILNRYFRQIEALGICEMTPFERARFARNGAIHSDGHKGWASLGPDAIETLPIKRLQIRDVALPPVWRIRLPPDLEVLVIRGCGIEQFEVELPPTLTYIGLAGNNLKSLPDLRHLTSLGVLNIKANNGFWLRESTAPPHASILDDEI